MAKNKLVSEFSTAYSNARILVKQGSVESAKQYVLKCLQILVTMYRQTSEVIARAKILALANRLKGIFETLRSDGITPEVMASFGIATTMSPAHASTSSTTPTQSAPTLEQAKSIDDVIDSLTHDTQSQGWCADLFEKYRPSVVEIIASSKNAKMCGTGFVISQNGFILTNDHVVFNEATCTYHTKITMQLADGCVYELQVIDSDAKSDVALCQYNINEVPKLAPIPRIANYSVLKQGADMLVIGNTFSLGLEPFSGTVRFTHDNTGDLVYTAPSNPGDSGGPVLNRVGECIGINKTETKKILLNGEVREANGMYNATPMDKIDELLAKWSSKHGLTI